MASPKHLQVDLRVEGRAVVVRAVGEVDMSTAPVLARQLSQAIATAASPHAVILDLRQAELFGSSGLAVLVTAHRRGQQHGTPLQVVAGPSVTRRLRMVGLLDLLSVNPTLSDALPADGDSMTGAGAPVT